MERALGPGDAVGDYTVVAAIESAEEYLAVHREHPRRVVIETARHGELRDPSLAHPGIARVWDHGTLAAPHRMTWRAVELADGIALYDVIARRRLAAFEVAILLRDIAEVLAYAHQRGVCHGALAIRSIVLTTDPAASAGVSIRGWGGPRPHGELGNAFVAPERSDGAHADLYALGAIAYRAMTGVFAPEVLLDPPGIGDLGIVILRLLAHDPSVRPSAGEVRVVAGRLAGELAAMTDEPGEKNDRVGAVPGPRFARPKWTPPPPDGPGAVGDGASPITRPLGSNDRGRAS